MADLYDQSRILAVLFESYSSDKIMNVASLYENFKFMDKAGNLKPALFYLRDTGYVEYSGENLYLTGKGMKTTKLLFRKFLIYIKRNYSDTLSTWIRILEPRKDSNREFIRDLCFYTQKEPSMV